MVHGKWPLQSGEAKLTDRLRAQIVHGVSLQYLDDKELDGRVTNTVVQQRVYD